jgi:hypothetical protein
MGTQGFVARGSCHRREEQLTTSPSNIVGLLMIFVGSISKSPDEGSRGTSPEESYEHNTHSQNTAHEIANGCTNRCATDAPTKGPTDAQRMQSHQPSYKISTITPHSAAQHEAAYKPAYQPSTDQPIQPPTECTPATSFHSSHLAITFNPGDRPVSRWTATIQA